MGLNRCRILLAVPLLLLTASAPLVAQVQPATTAAVSGPYARIVVLAPKPEQHAEFEAGYQRHLAWHRTSQDPWTWYGWSFVLGPRLGWFMDGTFGHPATDFDQAVQPAADAADNAINVSPFADFISHGVYQQLVTASRGAPLPDTTALLVLETYRLAPGRGALFEQLLRKRASADAQRPSEARYTWYRLELGGTSPQYLLLRAAPGWAGAVALPAFFEAGDGSGRAVVTLPADIVLEVTRELLRYRPTLSTRP